MHLSLRLLAASCALGALGGCSARKATPHVTLAGDFAPLRAAFNADSGEVRAIFLASPT
jgi:hypothetical protein